MTASRKNRRVTFRRELMVEQAGQCLRKAGFIMTDADPIAASSVSDRAGRLRRIEATYADGSYASLRFHKNGGGGLVQGVKLKLTTRGDAA